MVLGIPNITRMLGYRSPEEGIMDLCHAVQELDREPAN
jgi:hypothetical protein